MRNFKLIFKGEKFDLGNGRSPRGVRVSNERAESVNIKIDEDFNSLELNKLIKYLHQLDCALSIETNNKSIPDYKEELEITDKLLENYKKVIEAIPECNLHGKYCIPNALEWIDEMKKSYESKIFISCDPAFGEDKKVVAKVEVDKKDGINVSFIERPPIGIIPKKIHEEKVKKDRFNDICGAISRYYNASLKIPVEWINEYNELVGNVLNIGKEK